MGEIYCIFVGSVLLVCILVYRWVIFVDESRVIRLYQFFNGELGHFLGGHSGDQNSERRKVRQRKCHRQMMTSQKLLCHYLTMTQHFPKIFGNSINQLKMNL